MKNNAHMETAIKAAVSAGTILTRYYTEKVEVSNKESTRDIVSEVDKIAENNIIEILKKYDDSISIITEEQGRIYQKSKDKYWLIDALDGTVNYIHHIPFFSVSIAYVENNVAQAAAIYSPMFNDLYYASRTAGAFKNDKALKIKDVPYSEALFSVSFSGKNYEPDKRGDEFIAVSKVNDTSRGCLRTGSAALNLAYLADSRFNGCWGKANKYWDIAAGILIAEMAGAKIVTKFLDDDHKLCSYIATSPEVYSELEKKVGSVLELG
jgi:myo-inositol-1(or 4)-monophosphatase